MPDNTPFIARLDASQGDFDTRLSALLAWDSVSDSGVAKVVEDILQSVKARGDAAVVEYTNRLDRRQVKHMEDLTLAPETLQQALGSIAPEQRQALELAAERVRRYHEHQLQSSWRYTEEDGTVLGQQITAMERVGLYVPGGKASYPSSVLMNAIPAKVAGVAQLVMMV